MSSPPPLTVMLSVSAARPPGVCAKTIRRWDTGGQLHCLRTGMCGVQVVRVGEYDRRDRLYCPHCGSELHADVSAVRNIIEVQRPSTVAGWTGT
ncbi:MAG: hypothetical protein DRO73_07135 [Candidatus Thorarchaeota archaeon]|nr:MAG: hypothetical protein DRO73_07135 [Candidatus Thorarchaeota archaeon]